MPGINLKSLTSFLVTCPIATRPCSEDSPIWINFSPLRDTSTGQKELTHTMASVSVFVCLLLVCVKNIFFITRLYFLSSMEPFFFSFLFSFSGDYRNRFKAKPCLLPLFFPPCFVGALRIQRGRSSQWSALFSPPGPGRTLGGSVGNEASIICDLPHPLSRSVPTLTLSQAWRKLIVLTLCSTAHQTPACASPVPRQSQKTSPSRGRGTRDPGFRLPRMPDLSIPGLTVSREPWAASRPRQRRGGGKAIKLMTPRVPRNCNGHRKGDLINLPDELCITSACLPPSLKALLFSSLESDQLSPHCLESCCPTSISEAFGAWLLCPPNRGASRSWQNDWNATVFKTYTCARAHAHSGSNSSITSPRFMMWGETQLSFVV